jgi:hypothetical protein
LLEIVFGGFIYLFMLKVSKKKRFRGKNRWNVEGTSSCGQWTRDDEHILILNNAQQHQVQGKLLLQEKLHLCESFVIKLLVTVMIWRILLVKD